LWSRYGIKRNDQDLWLAILRILKGASHLKIKLSFTFINFHLGSQIACFAITTIATI
ncbi:2980_t:CDS:2, partial [Gigaspora rosea]